MSTINEIKLQLIGVIQSPYQVDTVPDVTVVADSRLERSEVCPVVSD